MPAVCLLYRLCLKRQFLLTAIAVNTQTQQEFCLVHLPVQSGSDKVLTLMNRKHTISEYLKIFDGAMQQEQEQNVEFLEKSLIKINYKLKIK